MLCPYGLVLVCTQRGQNHWAQGHGGWCLRQFPLPRPREATVGALTLSEPPQGPEPQLCEPLQRAQMPTHPHGVKVWPWPQPIT